MRIGVVRYTDLLHLVEHGAFVAGAPIINPDGKPGMYWFAAQMDSQATATAHHQDEPYLHDTDVRQPGADLRVGQARGVLEVLRKDAHRHGVKPA